MDGEGEERENIYMQVSLLLKSSAQGRKGKIAK